MERQIVINYRLRNVIEPSENIPLHHQSILEYKVNEKITQMLDGGFTSGELIEYVVETDNDTQYKGYWDQTFKVIKQ
jgi:hypothetical protein